MNCAATALYLSILIKCTWYQISMKWWLKRAKKKAIKKDNVYEHTCKSRFFVSFPYPSPASKPCHKMFSFFCILLVSTCAGAACFFWTCSRHLLCLFANKTADVQKGQRPVQSAYALYSASFSFFLFLLGYSCVINWDKTCVVCRFIKMYC